LVKKKDFESQVSSENYKVYNGMVSSRLKATIAKDNSNKGDS
jgi:hypothetical protein